MSQRSKFGRSFSAALQRIVTGARYEDVQRVLKPLGLTCRIVKKNGKYVIVTRDYRPDRLNCEVVDSFVVVAEKWG
jgi:hypothetical protein